MSITIPGGDVDYDFSENFNYAAWNADTVLTMVNVPWNNDYRDVVRFTGQTTLNTWIDAQPNTKLQNTSLQKFNNGIVHVPTTINRALTYNYLRAKNGPGAVGDAQRTYYYFITDVQYIAPNTTRLIIQLDVWQTFGYEVQFGNCYIERGHIGIANTAAFDHYGRDWLTIPEGLDTGAEYRTVHHETTTIASLTAPDNSGLQWDVLVCSTLDLTQDPGTVQNPSIKSAIGGTFQGLPSGANFYLFKTPAMFSAWLAIRSGTPWITQSIISVTLIPSMSRYVPGYNYGTNLGDSNIMFYRAGQNTDTPQPKTVSMLGNWRNNNFIATVLGSRYAGLKKFLTAPYMMLELTTFTSSPIMIRPEAWQDADATVRELAAFTPPGQRIAVTPNRYNADDANPDPAGVDDGAEFLDFATFLDNFPTLPVVNNMALNYLAANKNGIAFQYSSADWSQQRALAGAQAGVDVVRAQIQNTAMQSAVANRSQSAQAAATAQAQIGAAALGLLSGGLLGGGAAAAAGGPAGGLIQGAGATMNFAGQGGVIGAQLDNAQTSISARGDSTVADIRAQGSIRDTNNQYAQFAAKGDYANTVAGVDAKVQDTRMMQPSTSGQFGGDAFNIVNGIFGYSLRWKMLNTNALRAIGDYWLRYGYAVHRFGHVPASFMVMSKFTYWKLSETYITQGAFPEMFKQVLRGIFEKGVTVWAQPQYIGNTDLADNTPNSGVTIG